MTGPEPTPELETRDVYLGFVCNENRPIKKWGDILEVRDAKEVIGAGNRTVSCYIKVTDIPVIALQKLRWKTPLWNQKLYLFGYAKNRQVAEGLTGLMNVKKTLMQYMRTDVTQPVAEIPTVAWADLRDEVYDVEAMALADPETELEVDDLITPDPDTGYMEKEIK